MESDILSFISYYIQLDKNVLKLQLNICFQIRVTFSKTVIFMLRPKWINIDEFVDTFVNFYIEIDLNFYDIRANIFFYFFAKLYMQCTKQILTAFKGSDISIDSYLASGVCRPNLVPLSYMRLNSTYRPLRRSCHCRSL